MFRSLCKITFLLALALLLPRFLLLYAPQQHVFFGRLASSEHKPQLGVVSFNDFVQQTNLDLTGKKTLLVSNQFQDKNANHYLQFLSQYGIKPSSIYRGRHSSITTKITLESFDTAKNKFTESLVKHLTVKKLKKIDLILVDLQNSGFAQDEALQDLLEIMQLARLKNKKIVILDRPNPLGCLQEGPLVRIIDADLKFSMPLRYGLTLGEVASYINAQLFDDQLKLVILPLKHYARSNFNDFDQLQKIYTDGLFNILRNTCAVEIKTDCHNNVQCLALPEYLNFSIDKWYELRSALWHYNVDVVLCRYFDRKTQQYFVGVRLMINDINRVSYLKIWQLFFKFMRDANINLRSTLMLEKAFGTVNSQQLMTGNLDSDVLALWQHDLNEFYQKTKPYLIYRPWPVKVLL